MCRKGLMVIFDRTSDVQGATSTGLKFLRANLIAIAVLCVGSLLSIAVSSHSESRAVIFLSSRFNHDVELSLPTIYNYALILMNCGLALLIWMSGRNRGDRDAPYWLFMAVALFLMGYDEAARMHEQLSVPMQAIVPETPLLYFPWTPVGAIVALGVAAIFVPFLRRLPGPVVRLMVAAGAIYLIGALGVETLGGWTEYHFDRDWRFYALATIEESCEMLGMVVFGYALFLHIAGMRPPLRVFVE